MLIRLAPLALLLSLVGCAPEMRSFNVSVRNNTASPLTVALVKEGDPIESTWASPEDIASHRVEVGADSRLTFATIAPGGTQRVRNITGQFAKSATALLRIYRGSDLSVRDMLPIKPGSDRQDILLKTGDNRFAVRDAGGKLSIESLTP